MALGPQIVRKKSNRDRRAPTTLNGPANAFMQVRRHFSGSTNDDRQQSTRGGVVLLQRLKPASSAVGQRWA